MKQWFEFFHQWRTLMASYWSEEGWGFSTMENQSLMTDDLVENFT